MNSKSTLTDFVFYSFLVGGIFVMTKPGSQGPAFLKSLFGGYSQVVQASTGQAATA
jgi:hypothetical protein